MLDLPEIKSQDYTKTLGHGPMDNNVIRRWFASDNSESFIKNEPMLEKLGWNIDSIQYRSNDMGFRMDQDMSDISPGSCDFYLGCSLTIGVGLNLEDTWGWLMSQKSGRSMVNLSAPGGSLEHQYRYLKCWARALRPRKAYTIGAYYGRREILNDKTHGCALGSWLIKESESTMKNTYIAVSSERELQISWLRSFDAMRAVCIDNDIELYCLNMMARRDLFEDTTDHQCARDLVHHGSGWHKRIAELPDTVWERFA